MTWDAVFLCFSLTSQKGFDDAQTKVTYITKNYTRGYTDAVFFGVWS